MKTTLEHTKDTEQSTNDIDIEGIDLSHLTEAGKQRFIKVHAQESIIREVVDRHNTHYRRGRPYI
ncbi:MAG TPA: hypothetical protein VGE97_00900, partial [Nitrososphaera sp.]